MQNAKVNITHIMHMDFWKADSGLLRQNIFNLLNWIKNQGLKLTPDHMPNGGDFLPLAGENENWVIH